MKLCHLGYFKLINWSVLLFATVKISAKMKSLTTLHVKPAVKINILYKLHIFWQKKRL